MNQYEHLFAQQTWLPCLSVGYILLLTHRWLKNGNATLTVLVVWTRTEIVLEATGVS
jgi:hypothetical protein